MAVRGFLGTRGLVLMVIEIIKDNEPFYLHSLSHVCVYSPFPALWMRFSGSGGAE